MAGQSPTQKFEGSVSDHKIVPRKILKIMTQPELGKKIIELRKAKGLTQEELVEKCNISVRTIQRIESGEVTPRSYTVRTILDALGFDINDLAFEENHDGSGLSRWIKQQFLLDIDLQRPSNLMIRQLNLAWIFGIIYFIAGFFESSADFIRFSESRLIFHPVAYIGIKILILVSFIVCWRGFVIIGGLFKNYLLSVVSVIIMFGVLMSTILDITSIYHADIYNETTMGAMGLTFGVLGILFGISLIRLRKEAGELALAAGAFQLLAGFFFMTLVLSFIGFIILIPAELCGIILIFKIAISLKRSIYEKNKDTMETSESFVV